VEGICQITVRTADAIDVVLAEWLKRDQLKFSWLVNYRADPKKAWGEVDPGVLFR
jgi:hypothetical protein